MDCSKVGKLIFDLRKEKNMTQKNLADAMGISDRTISKWERGLGCPDISLLNDLSEVLGVNIRKILSGNLDPNDSDGGNMRKIKFYVCSNCGNVLFSTGKVDLACCGRNLLPLDAKQEDDEHKIVIEEIENDYFVTINHEMIKSHYISFIAYVIFDRVLFIKLYAEQMAEVRIPKMYGGKLYAYCNTHGLWEKTIPHKRTNKTRILK